MVYIILSYVIRLAHCEGGALKVVYHDGSSLPLSVAMGVVRPSTISYGPSGPDSSYSNILPKCFDNFSITRLYGKCCVSFLRACTLRECRASNVESRTLEE